MESAVASKGEDVGARQIAMPEKTSQLQTLGAPS
jgi:hypothetical protein